MSCPLSSLSLILGKIDTFPLFQLLYHFYFCLSHIVSSSLIHVCQHTISKQCFPLSLAVSKSSSFQLVNKKYSSLKVLYLTSQIESLFRKLWFNSLHIKKTSQKELKIILWRLLKVYLDIFSQALNVLGELEPFYV